LKVNRYGPRVAFTCKVILTGEDSSCEGQALDLSLPGCLIECVHSLKVGDYVQLRLFLPDHAVPMDIPLAAVRWINSAKVGVEFIRSSEEDQRRLSAIVRHLMPSTGKDAKWKKSIRMPRAADD